MPLLLSPRPAPAEIPAPSVPPIQARLRGMAPFVSGIHPTAPSNWQEGPGEGSTDARCPRTHAQAAVLG
jgi:hypothetical protein